MHTWFGRTREKMLIPSASPKAHSSCLQQRRETNVRTLGETIGASRAAAHYKRWNTRPKSSFPCQIQGRTKKASPDKKTPDFASRARKAVGPNIHRTESSSTVVRHPETFGIRTRPNLVATILDKTSPPHLAKDRLYSTQSKKNTMYRALPKHDVHDCIFPLAPYTNIIIMRGRRKLSQLGWGTAAMVNDRPLSLPPSLKHAHIHRRCVFRLQRLAFVHWSAG